MESTPSSVYEKFDRYDFDSDQEFQSGLRALGDVSDPARLLTAKAFYYSRAVAPIDLDGYFQWKTAQPQAQEPDGGGRGEDGDAPVSLSFVEVVQKIAAGETIPGIRQIPDVLSEEPASKSTATAPRKPWEQH
ncbi:hypothetical protein H4S02_001253 [Coemansia sp. RSA 2611]|nr:hypothetical protein H4S02_001253 [Coemansia sp. RSA 2611]